MPDSPTNQTPGISMLTWLALASGLAVLGWGGLYGLVTQIHPTPAARLAFLVLWSMAWLGTTWPVLLAINQRWSRLATARRVWRQSGWAALYSLLIAWLQMNRALAPALGFISAAILILIEVLIILYERDQLKHLEADHDK
jgi:hypothetical protein